MISLFKAKNNLADFGAEVKKQTSSAGLKTLLETISKTKVERDTYGKMTALIGGRASELKAAAQTPAEIAALRLLVRETLSFTAAEGLAPDKGPGITSKTFGDYGWGAWGGRGHFDKEEIDYRRDDYPRTYLASNSG